MKKENNIETKTLKLISLNPKKYPDTEVECRVVDDMKKYVDNYIEKEENIGLFPKLAQKNKKVKVKLGKIGEKADTRVRVERNGHIYVIGETQGAVKIEGSMIVKNPDGEEYIVRPETFKKRYTPTKEKGIYAPLTSPIKYILLTEDIVFKAPWGENMFALKDAVVNITDYNEIYAISNEAFKATYTKIEEKPQVL